MRAVAIGGELRAIVETLAVEIGPRSVYRPAAMARAVEFLTREASLPGEGERALV